jgi:hypothetical protein
MIARSFTSNWNRSKTRKSYVLRLVSCILCTILASISTAAYPQETSVLRVVPTGTLVCLRLANPIDFDGKITNLVDSLDIPDVPSVSIAQLIDRITYSHVESLMDLENAGFDVKSDACVFWTSTAFEKFSIAAHVGSRELAEESVRYEMGGTDKQYKGVDYILSGDSSAQVFLEDVFVYSKDKAAIMDVIETHLKEKPSILQNEKCLANIKAFRSGDLGAYVALDEIISAFLPLLQLGAEKTKGSLSEQMKQQKATAKAIPLDPAKIVAAEIDMGLWVLQQIRSYAVSLGIGRDGIWVNDSLKFNPDSPICDFLDISPSRLELVRYLPGNAIVAGGITMDAESIEKYNSIMFDLLVPALQEKITAEVMTGLRSKYEAATHEVLSCLGDEVAFAVPAETDKMMPRFVYVFEIADEAKARRTIGDPDYILELSKPFYEAFGIDFQMTEGPSQKYTGVQINSFQVDLSKMMGSVPNAEAIYPEKGFLWYAFMDGKMIYAMSQSADTIKGAIDAVNGRRSGIMDSPNFEDIDIRLPGKSNAVVYISPMGYLNFVMGMAMAGRGMPGGTMAGAMKPSNVGLAVTTNLDGDGIRNFTYILVKEIQELISAGLSMGRMMK